jgi:hypothetical protein
MKIVIIGGTGLIGSKLALLLRARDHEVLQASPSRGVNAVTAEGLQAALAGADIVVDVSNSPSFEDKAVLHFFETGTRGGRNDVGYSGTCSPDERSDIRGGVSVAPDLRTLCSLAQTLGVCRRQRRKHYCVSSVALFAAERDWAGALEPIP